MAGCCNYNGTCRACIADGKYWFSTKDHASCCAFQPHLCGETIASLAEDMSHCKGPVEHTTVIISGVVLGLFFVIAMIIIIFLVKKGGIPSFFRRGRGDEMTPMIPMVRFSRSASVYSHDLVEHENEL